MKIRHRLSLIFTLTITGVLLAIIFVVYSFSREFHTREFYEQLEERAVFAERFFLEVDNFPPQLADQLREDFMAKLPEEIELLLDISKPIPPEFKATLQDFVATAYPGQIISFEEGERQGVALVTQSEGQLYFVVVTALDRFGLRKLANLRRILAWAFPLGLILAGSIGWWTTKKALEPLEVNIREARQISASTLDARLALPKQKDEIYDFASIFNEVLERLEKTFIFQRSFIRSASHEIRNPLTAIIGEADVALLSERTAESYRKSLTVIAEEADRLNHLINNLLNISKTNDEETASKVSQIPLATILQEVRASIQNTWPTANIKWPALTGNLQNLTIPCHWLLLRSALVNVLDNACKYGKDLPIRVEVDAGDRELRFRISDSGIGIPAEEMPLILQPLYRCKNARAFKGQGIGLPLVDRIITLHQGRLDIDSDINKGTVVNIALPLG
jgi:signal transduction histidine kinase